MADKTILAIDDESDILLIIRTALESEGYKVLTASNGPDGIASAKEAKPDLIVLDVMMPDMDGFEVLRRLRADDATLDIPVVMLTGLSDKDRIKSALDMGVSHYIVKPFELDDFLRVVGRAMSDTGIDLISP